MSTIQFVYHTNGRYRPNITHEKLYRAHHEGALPVLEAVEREMQQQQWQDGQIRDETNDLVSLYLTAPTIVSLSLSPLLVEAIISQPHLSYCLILFCPFVSRRFIVNQGLAVRGWSFGFARYRRMNYRQSFLCLYRSRIVCEGNKTE